jgi:3-oxoadipate enol-lactonase
MPIAERNGVRLHWEQQGAGSPILLIMGHRYSSAMWHPLMPALMARHRVIWFDNRGTGGSDSPTGFTVRDMALDALAVMDAAGAERAHVFGVSMGGGIALELAIHQPQRVTSLLLGCTAMLTADKPRMPPIVRTLYYLPPWALRLILPKQTNQGYGSAAPADAIAADQAVLAKDKSVVRGVVAQAAAMHGYSVSPEAVAALAMPSLVMHGDEDSVVPLAWGAELAEALPNSRFVNFPGCGHNYIVAARDQAAKTVLDFIEAVDRLTP